MLKYDHTFSFGSLGHRFIEIGIVNVFCEWYEIMIWIRNDFILLFSEVCDDESWVECHAEIPLDVEKGFGFFFVFIFFSIWVELKLLRATLLDEVIQHMIMVWGFFSFQELMIANLSIYSDFVDGGGDVCGFC